MFPNNIIIIVKIANNINKPPLICIIALISNVLFPLNNLLLNKSFKSKLNIKLLLSFFEFNSSKYFCNI